VNKSDTNEYEPTEVEGRTWTNGFTLKKTTSGYSWTISMAPFGQSIAEMEEVIDAAARLDAKLRAMYGTPEIKARLK
jgi:hypothetical protein